MNIALICGPLAFLTILYTSVQGRVWPLYAAQVGDETYKNEVSLQRNEDGSNTSYIIRAIPENSSSDEPKIVHGPFELQGFGPYSMLLSIMWLNTDIYVCVTFHSTDEAREFYHIINPYHSSTFLNDFKIKELLLYSFNGKRVRIFEGGVPKALDIFILGTETGENSSARSYVVHDTLGDQEPILIFHSSEHEISPDGDYIMLSVCPKESPKTYRFRLEFEDPSSAKRLLQAYSDLNSTRSENLKDLEALPRNTYPTRPPLE